MKVFMPVPGLDVDSAWLYSFRESKIERTKLNLLAPGFGSDLANSRCSNALGGGSGRCLVNIVAAAA